LGNVTRGDAQVGRISATRLAPQKPGKFMNENENEPVEPRKEKRMTKTAVLISATLAMVSWVLVFGAGILIASKPYREQLTKAFDWLSLVKAVLTFTPTNVAILSMLAGFIGGCASLLLYGDDDRSTNQSPENDKPPVDEDRMHFLTEHPLGSAIRGFAVFLAFLAGTVTATNDAFGATTPDQYCRMAGAVAVLAFAVGYDPTFFRQFISALPRKK
jgi:hypothetical protein